MVEGEFARAVSRDGTLIAWYRTGKGSPLVLVHGTTADHTRWRGVAPVFADRYSVHAVDRRGRGESGDSAAYALDREFEDIAAVIDAMGEPVNLLGHSYGGLCALEAALLTPNVRKLVLYEPPITLGAEIYPRSFIEQLQAMLDAGDREQVLATFLREVVHMPPHEFELYRSLPAWPKRVAAAHTIPRELRASADYAFDPGRFSGLRTPAMLLLGGESPSLFQNAVQAVQAALPDSRIHSLPGQQHIAMDTAPGLFTAAVLEFLEGR